jgi:hypothetical protein
MSEKVANTFVASQNPDNAREKPARGVAPQRTYPNSLGPSAIPPPTGSGRRGHITYRSVLFYGARLADALAETVEYLELLEKLNGSPPHTVFVHEEFSWEDAGSDLAWQVTLVFGEPARQRSA